MGGKKTLKVSHIHALQLINQAHRPTKELDTTRPASRSRLMLSYKSIT